MAAKERSPRKGKLGPYVIKKRSSSDDQDSGSGRYAPRSAVKKKAARKKAYKKK